MMTNFGFFLLLWNTFLESIYTDCYFFIFIYYILCTYRGGLWVASSERKVDKIKKNKIKKTSREGRGGLFRRVLSYMCAGWEERNWRNSVSRMAKWYSLDGEVKKINIYVYSARARGWEKKEEKEGEVKEGGKKWGRRVVARRLEKPRGVGRKKSKTEL